MVLIHCGGCQDSFTIGHPSIQNAAQAMRLTLRCPLCGVTLKAPEFELHMEAVQVRPKLQLVQ